MEKHFSGINTFIIIRYFQKKYPEIPIEAFLDGIIHSPDFLILDEKTDQPKQVDLECLLDTNCWFPNELFTKLFSNAEKITGDPYVAYKAGRASYELQKLNWMNIAMRYVSVPTIIRRLPDKNTEFNRNKKIEVVKVTPSDAIVRLHFHPDKKANKYFCSFNRGVYESLGQITGTPATVEEPICTFDGNDYCEFHITWEERPFLKRLINRIKYWIAGDAIDILYKKDLEKTEMILKREGLIRERTEQYKHEKDNAETLAAELQELNQQLKIAYDNLEASSARILALTQELNAEKSVAMRGSQAHDILHQQKNHLALVATNLEFTYRTIDKLEATLESMVAALPDEQRSYLAEEIERAKNSYDRTQKVKPLIFEGMERFNLTYQALDRLSKDDGMTRNIKEDLESLMFILQDNYGQHGIIIEKDIQPVITPKLYGPLANDIYINFIQNAFEELTKLRTSGHEDLKIFIKAAVKGSEIVVEVHDTGSGIKEEDRERVFELFVSEKGRGTGLPTCRRIAGKYGARVYNTRSDIAGYTTKFVAEFPLQYV